MMTGVLCSRISSVHVFSRLHVFLRERIAPLWCVSRDDRPVVWSIPSYCTFVAVSLLQFVPPSHKEDPIVLSRCTSTTISRSPLRSAMLRTFHSCSTNRMALVAASSLSVAFQCILCPAAQLSFPPASSRDFLWPVHRPRCLHVVAATFILWFATSHAGTDEDDLQGLSRLPPYHASPLVKTLRTNLMMRRFNTRAAGPFFRLHVSASLVRAYAFTPSGAGMNDSSVSSSSALAMHECITLAQPEVVKHSCTLPWRCATTRAFLRS